jgi:hypothetical protein
VLDGVKLARKYRLPRRIDDFILEHHGTMITRPSRGRAGMNPRWTRRNSAIRVPARTRARPLS